MNEVDLELSPSSSQTSHDRATASGNEAVPASTAFDLRELAARRQALGYSRGIFAEVLGVAPFMVEAWERGIARIDNPEWLRAALEALETSRGDAQLLVGE